MPIMHDLTITTDDLDRAMQAVQRPGSYTDNCLIAQAVRRQVGKPDTVGCTATRANFFIDRRAYDLFPVQETVDLIVAFDHGHFDELRAKLPVTLTYARNRED